MKVAIGSTNRAKVHALEKLSTSIGFTVIARSVPTHVSNQPQSDSETIQGAVNRAREVLMATNSDVGIGLEGGISKIGTVWFVCNWGALIDRKGYECVSSGGHFMLPETFLHELECGKELGEVIKAQTQLENQSEGAIGLLTNGFVTRQSIYEQLLNILFGQYFYYKKRL
ncbi:DUF84 family protein [Pueribacillus sp. YX66]|uniref:DUF84 family protein n=1 Tax=Pueribacillus sp. YX66 TaxID=3229242 RepID=UPI00358D43AC